MPIDPFFITIHPTAAGSCTFKCPGCFSKELEAKRGIDPKAALTKEHALQISRIAGGRQLGFTGGGEPFMHKNLVEFVRLSCSGPKTPEGFTIITNGAGFATEKETNNAVSGLDQITEKSTLTGRILLSVDPAHVNGHPQGKKEASVALKNFISAAEKAGSLQLAVKVSLPEPSVKNAKKFLESLGVNKLPSRIKLVVEKWVSPQNYTSQKTSRSRLPENIVLAANGDVFLGQDYHQLRKPFDNINHTPIDGVFSKLYKKFEKLPVQD